MDTSPGRRDDGTLTRDEAKAAVGPGWAALVDEWYDACDNLGYAPSVIEMRNKQGGLYMEIVGRSLAAMPAALIDIKADIRARSWLVCDECGGVAVHSGRLVSRCGQHPIEDGD